MIHTLLNLTRPLIVPDTETTGLHDDARIIELGFQMWTAEGLVKEWRSLINPLMPIPPQSTAIHGITDADMLLCQTCKSGRDECACEHFKIVPTFKMLAPHLVKGFTNCDFGGKNVRFDLGKLFKEFERSGVPWDYIGARIIDADRLEAIVKPRNLSAMYKDYTGKDLEDAHSALVDVAATTEVIWRQLFVHEVLPRDLDQLHALSWPGWLVADGSFRITNGEPTVVFGKHKGTPMKDVPVSYWDWMLSPKAKFPADVLKLVSNAKLGIFPTVTTEEAVQADKRMDHAG